MPRLLFGKIPVDRKLLGALIALFAVIFYACFWSAPEHFPSGMSYDVAAGETYTNTAYALRDMGAVRSPFWFKTFVYLFALGQRRTLAGDYALPERQNVLTLAWRFSHGNFDVEAVRVTVPEGMSTAEIAPLLSARLPGFDAQKFLGLVASTDLEGYLFPDTYLFLPDATPAEVIAVMHENFNEKMAPLLSAIASSTHAESAIVTMASVLEKEARTDTDRRIIAGILWKRIALGMPLQVDSSLAYVTGKSSAELTVADLATSSPYNTYTHRGLPPGPISNPGIEAIEAALNPTKTPYLYFLSDSAGNIHYAATNAEQNANKAKYLQ